MASKIEEAEKLAKTYCEKAHPQTPKEAVYVAGFLTGQEHSKEVIEELVKALEEARSALSFAQQFVELEMIDAAYVEVRKAIDKIRNNEKQG